MTPYEVGQTCAEMGFADGNPYYHGYYSTNNSEQFERGYQESR